MTGHEPLVSIVLPTYNRAHVLPHAIDSVLAQTYKQLELIVVDDNSPDNTREIVESISDPRIRYVRNEPNLKLPRALNRGFSLSKGEYLTWTSDDNLFAPEAIEKMVAALQRSPDCEFVYTDYYLFSETNDQQQPVSPKHVKQPGKLQLEKGNHIGACFLYTRRLYEKIGDYDPDLFLVEDYDYFIRASKTFNFCHIPEPLYYFRRDDDTLYYSRYCEVKSSDILVRYKNQLITPSQFIDAIIAMVMSNFVRLKRPLWRTTYLFLEPISFSLAKALKARYQAGLEREFSSRVKEILEDFDSGNSSFTEARDKLVDMINRQANIKPIQVKN